MRILVLGSAAALLAACTGQNERIAKLTPPEIDRFSRDYMALVARGRLDSAAAFLLPSVDRAEEVKVFPELSRIMKRGSLDSARIVGVHVSTVRFFSGKSTRRTDLTYEMPADTGFLVVNIITIDSGSVRHVYRVDIQQNTLPLSEQNKDDLEAPGTGDLLMFAAVVTNVVLSVFAFGTLLFARGMPKRKRWMLASLFGVGKFSWTMHGASSFSLLSIQLFGVGITGDVISISIPLGALAAFWQYYRWLNPPPAAPDDTTVQISPPPEAPPPTA